LTIPFFSESSTIKAELSKLQLTLDKQWPILTILMQSDSIEISIRSPMPPNSPRTIRLHDRGRSQIEQARQVKGWTTEDPRWLQAASEIILPEPSSGWAKFWQENPDSVSPSRSTLKHKFLRQQNIRREYFIALCTAVNINWVEVADLENPSAGDPPPPDRFFGRTQILHQLQDWLSQPQHRLILLYGRAGIGKTAIAYRLIQQQSDHFQSIVWASLETLPPLSELITRLLKDLAINRTHADPCTDLYQHLQQHRCLLILDQWETILSNQTETGYQTGYSDYATCLQALCQNHQSCVILLSREKPAIPTSLPPIQALEITELTYRDDRDFLIAEQLQGSETELAQFIAIYNNPLILKLIADRVRTIHGGRVATLVTAGATIYSNADISKIIKSEFLALSPLEQAIVYWLAIWRLPINYAQLHQSLLTEQSRSAIDESLYCLISQRSLVKVNAQTEYYLDPVTLKEITNLLVKQLTIELTTALSTQPIPNLQLLVSHCLTIGDDPDILAEQRRRIVHSTIAKLRPKFTSLADLVQQLHHLQTQITTGYAPTNLPLLITAAQDFLT
jgi:hypothetical protein